MQNTKNSTNATAELHSAAWLRQLIATCRLTAYVARFHAVLVKKKCTVEMCKRTITCCVNPVSGTGRTSVDISGDANLELVDKFCYLGDMLSVYGDADAAVETRI